jgi:hypothetical protein
VNPDPYLQDQEVEVMVRYDRGGQGGWEILGRGRGVPINPDGTFSVVWKPQKNGIYEFKASFSSDELVYRSEASPHPFFTIYSNSVRPDVEGETSDTD